MKKIILLLSLFVITKASYSQVSEGKMFVGGAFGFGTNSHKSVADGHSEDGDKKFNFALSPQFGYFVTDKIALRAGLDFSTNSTKTPLGDGDFAKTAFNSFGLNVGGRYYMMLNDNFGVLGELALGFNSGKYKDVDPTGTTEGDKIGGFGMGVYPGIIYFPTPKFGIEAIFGGVNSNSYLLGFTSTTTTDTDNNKEKDFDFGFGLNTLSMMQFGFNYYFGGK